MNPARAARTGIAERTGTSWDDWYPDSSYEIVGQYQITFTALRGAEDWYLLRKKS